MKDKWLLDHFYVPQTEPAKPRSVQRIVRRQKPMTMPHLMNCEHAESGWCLACVRKLHDELEETRAILNEKCGNEECFDAMNKARIQQSLPKEYLEAITKATKSSNDQAQRRQPTAPPRAQKKGTNHDEI